MRLAFRWPHEKPRSKGKFVIARAYRLLVRTMVNLKFAVVLLVVIAAAAIAGTLVGGAYGEDAQARFFASAPFSALMILFMFALVLAVVSRYPWKLTHTGWIMTHAGLVVIVIGHMITARYGINARVSLFEGESSDVAEGEQWYLFIDLPQFEGREQARVRFGLDEAPDVPLGREVRLPSGDLLRIERYSPNFTTRLRVEPEYSSDEPEDPAVRVELTAVDRRPPARGGPRRRTRSEWLFAARPRESSKVFSESFTALYRRFSDRGALEAFLAPKEPAGTPPALLVEPMGRPAARIELPLDRPGAPARAVGDTGYTVKVLRRFERLRVVENQAVEASEGPLMPAVEVEIATPQGERDRRWLFARMPDADTRGKVELPFTLRYREGALAALGGELPPGSLAILEAPGAPPVRLLLGPSGERDLAPLAVGERIALPWLGAEAVVAERFVRTKTREEPATATYLPSRPAVLVTLEGRDGASETRWVRWQKPARPVEFRDGAVRMRLGPQETPLGFTVTLKDFVLKTYEGTNTPKSFESFVRVRPHDGDPAFDFHIYMNHVMDYRGWRFFQSSYDPDTLAWSSFTASYDPGRKVVYTGYILTPLGLLFIVFVKPVLLRREAARRAAAGLAKVEANNGGGEDASRRARDLGEAKPREIEAREVTA
jgi:hypothetical protein